MNSITKFFMVGLLALSVGISSCGKDDGVGGTRCADAAQAWTNASADFSFDVTTNTVEECEAWVAAFNQFVDRCNLEDYLTDVEYQDYLDEIAAFPCEEFL